MFATKPLKNKSLQYSDFQRKSLFIAWSQLNAPTKSEQMFRFGRGCSYLNPLQNQCFWCGTTFA